MQVEEREGKKGKTLQGFSLSFLLRFDLAPEFHHSNGYMSHQLNSMFSVWHLRRVDEEA